MTIYRVAIWLCSRSGEPSGRLAEVAHRAHRWRTPCIEAIEVGTTSGLVGITAESDCRIIPLTCPKNSNYPRFLQSRAARWRKFYFYEASIFRGLWVKNTKSQRWHRQTYREQSKLIRSCHTHLNDVVTEFLDTCLEPAGIKRETSVFLTKTDWEGDIDFLTWSVVLRRQQRRKEEQQGLHTQRRRKVHRLRTAHACMYPEPCIRQESLYGIPRHSGQLRNQVPRP